MTPERIAGLRALEQAATPGPWTVREANGYYFLQPPGDHRMGHRCRENAEFIAAARIAVPELLDENAELRAKVAELEVQVWLGAVRGGVL